MDLIGIIRRLPEIVAYNKFDDDLFDRLNYSHTVTILTVFAIIVTNRQFSENQIKCWVRFFPLFVSSSMNWFRYQHNSLVVMSNMSIRYVLSRILIHLICTNLCRMIIINVMNMNWNIINGRRLFFFSWRFYSIFHINSGVDWVFEVASIWKI